MEDRVGDVLARRAALDSGIGVGIVLSILLHGGLTAAAVWAAMHAPAPPVATVLTIQFAGNGHRAASRPARPVPPLPKPKEEPVEVPVTTTTPPAKAQPKTVPFSSFGKSTKKGSEHAAAPPAPAPVVPAAKPAALPGMAAPGEAGITGIEGGDFPYSLYLQRMWSLISSHWFRPATPAGTTATIHFVVDRDGTIRDVALESPSGNATYDRNAQRAILETSPLPPLPYGYGGTFLGVHLTFK